MSNEAAQSGIEMIILGAGRPFSGAEPSVLHSTRQGGSRNGRVLDWLLGAVQHLRPRVHFISGYRADEVQQQYPRLRYTHNPAWESTGAARSLLLAPVDTRHDCLVSYADIVFHRHAVDRLAATGGDIVVAVDSQWRRRYAGRTEEDLARCEKVHYTPDGISRLGADLDPALANAEFTGLVRLSAPVMQWLRAHNETLVERFSRAKLAGLIEWLRMQGFGVRAVDLAGDWAELNEPRDLAHFVLGTKAQTLQRLQGLVQCSRIEDQVSFTVGDWQSAPETVLHTVAARFGEARVVVRSSALSEDGFASANAGAYTSVLDVPVADREALQGAIRDVVASYPAGDRDDQVLVQPMLTDVAASGVAFTRTLSRGAPYYVINYDDCSGSTASITDGSSSAHRTVMIRRDAGSEALDIPAPARALLPALREIESLLGYDSLDVEFACDTQGLVHVLQVRPIAVRHESSPDSDRQVLRQLEQARDRFRQLQTPGPSVAGRRTVFGIMPDWNPAEIIGTRPGRLATSLYRWLITDETWAAQRAGYGYRDVRPQPLLHSFAGHPYIDVRASLSSFLPAGLDDALAARLVDFCLDWLEQHPSLHDKLEFEVIPTCLALDFPHWEQRFIEDGGFSAEEVAALREGLASITEEAMNRGDGDARQIGQLEQRFERIMAAPMAPLDRAAVLLEDCRRFGTLPFAHLARSAFVAVTLLRSAVTRGIIPRAAVDGFLGSVRTVSHRLNEDAGAVGSGRMSRDDFVQRYGHLRPGTYDITSPCYAAEPGRYLDPLLQRLADSAGDAESGGPGVEWQQARPRLLEALAELGLPAEAGAVEMFLRTAIEGREYAKFAFSRNLSAALEALADWGSSLGLGRDTLADVTLEDLLALRAGTAHPEAAADWVTRRAAEGAAERALAERIELPPLLCRESDFDGFEYPSSQPNFVGSGCVTAPCVDLAGQTAGERSLQGCVVMIPQADPGHDWLFGQGIAALITLYGGANSHMAIRAAEFGLPAAIGIGETRYQHLSEASVLRLDAGNRQIQVVQ
ncbi:MAG: PEP-utilizing enzyme [Pseudomonadota bacterium]